MITSTEYWHGISWTAVLGWSLHALAISGPRYNWRILPLLMPALVALAALLVLASQFISQRIWKEHAD